MKGGVAGHGGGPVEIGYVVIEILVRENWLPQKPQPTSHKQGTFCLSPRVCPPESVPPSPSNYGRTVSASSLIYEGNGFFIRMYAYDHNPPHFHVLLHRDTSESLAKCAIQTLDVLAGNLPSALRRPIREWASTHRPDLMQNWERCQAGNRPHLLEN